MDILFLGTGAGVPSKTRNVASLCLRMLQELQTIWMFDCGEGTQQQLFHFPVKLRQLDKVFITHLHGDHIFGLPGLLTTRSSQGATQPLTLFGPPGIDRFVKTALEVSCSHLSFNLSIKEISHPGVVLQESEVTVVADFLQHNVPSVGYRVIEAPRPGRLNAPLLRQLGVPEGPAYGELKVGKAVTLDDGRVIEPAGVVTPAQPGRIVAILGDTRPTETAVTLADKADLLVHEATFSAKKSDLAAEYGHSTAADAARVAAEAHVRQLVLTHISQRYTLDTVQQLLEEARSIFPDTVLAYDGTIIEVPFSGASVYPFSDTSP